MNAAPCGLQRDRDDDGKHAYAGTNKQKRPSAPGATDAVVHVEVMIYNTVKILSINQYLITSAAVLNLNRCRIRRNIRPGPHGKQGVNVVRNVEQVQFCCCNS